MRTEAPSIDHAYFILMPTCPCYLAPDGERYLDHLWAKDLARHTDYIRNISVAAPLIRGDPPTTFVPVRQELGTESVKFVDLPPAGSSLMEALVRFPRAALAIWVAISRTQIVHAGVIGWPLPLGLLGIIFGRLQGKFVVTMVEGAPWRLPKGGAHRLKHRVRAAVFEVVNRYFLGWAHVPFFTSEDYRATLLPAGNRRGHVIHASWIDGDMVSTSSEVQAAWTEKTASRGPLKLLFAGRLVDAKGVGVLLDAARLLEERQTRAEIDIVGEGPLRAKCENAATNGGASTRIRVLETVRYGREFFDILRRYHAVVVPSLSDEQPRIVYDAFACGIPVLASDTPGLRSCVIHGRTGYLDQPGSAKVLADRVESVSTNIAALASMGLAARNVAAGFTHRSMHARRATILHEALRMSERRPPRVGRSQRGQVS